MQLSLMFTGATALVLGAGLALAAESRRSRRAAQGGRPSVPELRQASPAHQVPSAPAATAPDARMTTPPVSPGLWAGDAQADDGVATEDAPAVPQGKLQRPPAAPPLDWERPPPADAWRRLPMRAGGVADRSPGRASSPWVDDAPPILRAVPAEWE
jgi:hypothetical protein